MNVIRSVHYRNSLKKNPSWQVELVKKFSAFYGNRRFITLFIGARHLFTSWARSIQTMPSHITSLKYLSILSSHLGLPSHLFPLGFPTKTLCAPLLSPIRAIFLAKLILLDMVTPENLVRNTDLSNFVKRILSFPIVLQCSCRNTKKTHQSNTTPCNEWHTTVLQVSIQKKASSNSSYKNL